MQGRRRLACHAQLLGQSHNAIAVQSNLTHKAKIALHSLACGNQQQPTLHTPPPNATRDCACSLKQNALSLLAPRGGSGETLAATTLTPPSRHLSTVVGESRWTKTLPADCGWQDLIFERDWQRRGLLLLAWCNLRPELRGGPGILR
jgi:hypothetical protein